MSEENNNLVNLPAEQSLIGGVMLVGMDADFHARTEYVFQTVQAADFYSGQHKLIWNEICSMVERKMPVDLLTLHDRVESKGLSEKTGGFAYLAELSKNTPSAANINAYADMVIERANAREVIRRMNAARELIMKDDGRPLSVRMAEASDITTSLDQISAGRMLFNPEHIISQQLETIDNDYSTVEKVFEEAIKHKDLALLTGAGGTGKSWATIKLAISVALGSPAFRGQYDCFIPTSSGVVVFLIGEDSIEDYRHRLDKVIRAQHMTREQKARILSSILFVPLRDRDIRLIKRERGGDLEHTGVIRNLASSLKRAGCRLAIFDPMNKFASGEENSNNEANVFIGAMRRVVDLSGAAALMVHHSSKSDPGGARGASALVDGVRCHLSLATLAQLKGEKAEAGDNDIIRLSMNKANHFRMWDGPVWLKRTGDGDMETMNPPETIGEGAIAKRFAVDVTRVRASIIEALRSNTQGMSPSAFISGYIESPDGEKLLGKNYGKCKQIVEDMINNEMLVEGTQFGRKVLLVNESGGSDFRWEDSA